MALKFASPIPLFSSPNLSPSSLRPAPSSSTELRFSRWNNANAEPFLRRRREQKEIEDDIRRHRRYQSALKIAQDDPAQDLDAAADSSRSSSAAAAPDFKSRGTPSSPSSPSIPGRASKYSKTTALDHHPAFRPIVRPPRPVRILAETPAEETGISISERGVSYKIKDAPFEFQYSYTETPKVKPLALREQPYLPFGPSTMPRPWTGRAPLPPSKKKLPEFDSFNPPPPGKKGVKPVQGPGPFLAGSGPRYQAASREEILGEPLTDEEVKQLVNSCIKTRRQLNIGRDGLTHNMLDNIHAHWKRRRVCKIKCKGVCTVDMDNVHQQLEEKTGGKIIYSKGGVVFLFRGRNYNYRTRPRYPLMLWKPVAPVYPRLVQRVPEGLTLEEATEMRKNGRQLPPICKLGKNGVYCNLVSRVREAFEACELVRMNCKGMNKSDCRKIGAKLKDLVPCVLISFEFEHILIWRGKDWRSSLTPLEDNQIEVAECMTNDLKLTSSGADENVTNSEAGPNFQEQLSTQNTKGLVQDGSRWIGGSDKIVDLEQTEKSLTICCSGSSDNGDVKSGLPTAPHKEFSIVNVTVDPAPSSGDNLEESLLEESCKSKSINEDLNMLGILSFPETEESAASSVGSTKLEYINGASSIEDGSGSNIRLDMDVRDPMPCQTPPRPTSLCLEGVRTHLKEAIEGGSAVILDDASLDPNIVYERSVALAKSAPPGPKFQDRVRKAAALSKEEKQGDNKKHEENMEVGIPRVSDGKRRGRKNPKTPRDNLSQILPDVVPHGSLKIDDLAKLLA